MKRSLFILALPAAFLQAWVQPAQAQPTDPSTTLPPESAEPEPVEPAAAQAQPSTETAQPVAEPPPTGNESAPVSEAAAETTVAAETAKPQPFKGFKIQSDDGDYQLKLGAFVQADGRFFTKAEGDPINTFGVRRARLEFRATLAKYFELRVHPELAESKLTLLDAFGNLHLIDEVQLQVGKMKSPVGLEYLASPTDLLFPEFGLPTLLVPQRDVGFYVHGDLGKGIVAYQLGLFNGVADGTNGDLDENSAKDFEYRIFAHPFKTLDIEPLAGFGVGFAGTTGKQEGVLPGFRSFGRESFFAYAATATAAGHRNRISPQVYYYYGPVGVLAEYVRSEQTVTDGVATGRIANSAGQLAGSVVIGGKAGYKGAEVDAPLDPAANTWGALELALRYGQLAVEQQAFDFGFADPASAARKASSFGIAASWWFLKGTRAQLSYDQTAFDGGDATGDRETEGVVVTRLQVAL